MDMAVDMTSVNEFGRTEKRTMQYLNITISVIVLSDIGNVSTNIKITVLK